jgi:hypothetical protein
MRCTSGPVLFEKFPMHDRDTWNILSVNAPQTVVIFNQYLDSLKQSKFLDDAYGRQINFLYLIKKLKDWPIITILLAKLPDTPTLALVMPWSVTLKCITFFFILCQYLGRISLEMILRLPVGIIRPCMRCKITCNVKQRRILINLLLLLKIHTAVVTAVIKTTTMEAVFNVGHFNQGCGGCGWNGGQGGQINNWNFPCPLPGQAGHIAVVNYHQQQNQQQQQQAQGRGNGCRFNQGPGNNPCYYNLSSNTPTPAEANITEYAPPATSSMPSTSATQQVSFQADQDGHFIHAGFKRSPQVFELFLQKDPERSSLASEIGLVR